MADERVERVHVSKVRAQDMCGNRCGHPLGVKDGHSPLISHLVSIPFLRLLSPRLAFVIQFLQRVRKAGHCGFAALRDNYPVCRLSAIWALCSHPPSGAPNVSRDAEKCSRSLLSKQM